MEYCKYCSNRATNLTRNPLTDENEKLCEIHKSYVKPREVDVNPTEIDRCIRCGSKSLNRTGTEQRLIQHHVNYPLDITVPVCDKCHSEIHSGDSNREYDFETTGSAFEPVGEQIQTGTAISYDYKAKQRSDRTGDCPSCGTEVIIPEKELIGNAGDYICPNGDCETTSLRYDEVK